MTKPAGGRSVPTRALYVGIGLCALLAIVALASRGDRPPASSGSAARDLPGGFFDWVFTISILLALAMTVIVAWVRASAGPQRKSNWQMRQMAMFVVAVAGFSIAAVLVAEMLRDNPTSPLARLLGRDTPARTDEHGRVIQPRSPEFEWSAVVVAGALAGGFGAWYVLRRRRRPEERTLREDLTAILDDTLAKLADEEDPRRAVILAYAWMERTLGAHGLPRVPSEAPLEYLARVLIELDASRESVFELTALFERAKFSLHEVDEEMKHEAIAALTSVRDDLRAAEELRAAQADAA